MSENDWNPHVVPAGLLMEYRQDPARPAQAAGTLGARQRGAVSIMFALMLLVLFGFIGLAFDLSLLYNRKVELQGVADAAAIAAARELGGTTTSVTNALSRAAATANSFKFRYHTQDVVWSDAAIKFSTARDAPESSWLDASAALATPNGLLFAQVDTSALSPAHNTVTTILMGLLYPPLATATTAGRAIAGRSMIKVTPLGICALSTTPANSRDNPGPPANSELEEFGFRRGVGYDLMNLNSNGTTPENFVINPIDPVGALGTASNTLPAVVGPFVCAGTLSIPRLPIGAAISVARPFPIGALFNQLNSRFDQYSGGLCSPVEAPPDFNIKAYVPASTPWMLNPPGPPNTQTAQSLASAGKLWTIASPFPAPGTNTAPAYGPLWSFARAVPFASYTPGTPEPTGGYPTFATTAWATLYKPGAPSYTGSTAATPYMANGGTNFLAPSLANRPGLRYRRVLNVPLLSCPVAAGTNVTATVLAIGRFFMTVPATATTISAEFAGVIPEQSLGGRVELYP
jgi:Flp pilus assembly protein TadG